MAVLVPTKMADDGSAGDNGGNPNYLEKSSKLSQGGQQRSAVSLISGDFVEGRD